MSIHTDKIINHSVHTNLTNLENTLFIIENMEGKPPAVVETIARIVQVKENFAISLRHCNENLVSISWLEEASKSLVNIANTLNNYKANKDANYLLNNTSTSLDVLLTCSTKLNCVKSTQNLRGVTASVNQYIRVLDLHQEEYHRKFVSLENKITELEDTIKNDDTTSKQNLKELQNSIASEKQRLDKLATSYQEQMATDKKAFIEQSKTFDESFKLTQQKQQETFTLGMERCIEKNETLAKSYKEQIDNITKRNKNLVDDYSLKFNEYEEQVKNIVGVVNTNMFSYKYKEVADDAHKRAKFWHAVAVVLMIAVGAFAVYAFIITVNEDTSWVKLIAKIFATTTLVTGAAYAARQASKQEKVERYARKIEMELVAIDPFIQSLDESSRSQIKEEISRKIFGNADSMEISNKDEAYTAMDKLTTIESLLMKVIEKIPK